MAASSVKRIATARWAFISTNTFGSVVTANPYETPHAAPRFSFASFAASSAIVAAASLAMAATLPGRSHGMGLITKPLLAEYASLSLAEFGQINMAATLAGGLLCLPCGWLIDRFGVRAVLGPVMLGLAAAVYAMSEVRSISALGASIGDRHVESVRACSRWSASC